MEQESMELRFVAPNGDLEHRFVAKRALIEARFQGLGKIMTPQLDGETKQVYYEIKLHAKSDKDPTPDWSGKTVEEIYRYYDHYATNGGKLPDFKDAKAENNKLEDVPGITEYELKLFRYDTVEETDRAVELARVSGYVCAKRGPFYDMAKLALAHLIRSLPLNEGLHRLRVDQEPELTEEEIEKAIADHPRLFDWM